MRCCSSKKLSPEQIAEVLAHEDCCCVGLCECNQPYVVPMHCSCEKRDGRTIFHLTSCANGMKIRCLRSNDKICLTVTHDHADCFYTVVIMGCARILDCDCPDKGINIEVCPHSITGRAVEKVRPVPCCSDNCCKR